VARSTINISKKQNVYGEWDTPDTSITNNANSHANEAIDTQDSSHDYRHNWLHHELHHITPMEATPTPLLAVPHGWTCKRILILIQYHKCIGQHYCMNPHVYGLSSFLICLNLQLAWWSSRYNWYATFSSKFITILLHKKYQEARWFFSIATHHVPCPNIHLNWYEIWPTIGVSKKYLILLSQIQIMSVMYYDKTKKLQQAKPAKLIVVWSWQQLKTWMDNMVLAIFKLQLHYLCIPTNHSMLKK